MYLYSIYISNHNQNPIIIKQGFSLWAMILNFFWAVYHKMWLVAFLFLMINFIVTYFGNFNITEKFFLFIIFGFFATEIREVYVTRKGFKLDDIILASSEEEAQVKYINRSAQLAS